jgi:hypothetical protein
MKMFNFNIYAKFWRHNSDFLCIFQIKYEYEQQIQREILEI